MDQDRMDLERVGGQVNMDKTHMESSEDYLKKGKTIQQPRIGPGYTTSPNT